MKRQLVLILLGSMALITACGGSLGSNGSAYLDSQDDFDGVDYDFGRWAGSSVLNSGMAHCNRFSVTDGSRTIASGLAQHPVDDYGDVQDNFTIVKISSLDPAWFNDANGGLRFVPIQDSATAGYTEGNNLISHVITNTANSYYVITPAILRQYGITAAPFYVMVDGTTMDWNVLAVDVMYSNNFHKYAEFLIPDFEANPSLYSQDEEVTDHLLRLHPFYSLMGQNLNFESKATKYCFYYPKMEKQFRSDLHF